MNEGTTHYDTASENNDAFEQDDQTCIMEKTDDRFWSIKLAYLTETLHLAHCKVIRGKFAFAFCHGAP